MINLKFQKIFLHQFLFLLKSRKNKKELKLFLKVNLILKKI